MKKTLCLILFTGLLTNIAQAQTMRCGTELVSVGNRGIEVVRKCGEPAYKEVIGYTLGASQRSELRIEEWIYGPRNGMYHYLRFEGGTLIKISSSR
ncbi:MAG: DUF2845 domain-containing protein [Gammaproteobacteria bacterium]|nr:DUF2845 domain-containing protein [Gammaproteobacteria bacterium]